MAAAGYHFRHGWAGRPESEAVVIVTETTHLLNSRPYGKPYRYPHASCGCTTGWFKTGEMPVGRHVASFAVRFEVGHGGTTVTGTVKSPEFAFEVTPADTPDDLVAPADPATEKLVREAIQLAETDEAFRPANAGRFRFGGGQEQDWWRPQITWADDGKPNGVHAPVWRLTKPLPVDLCFEATLRVEGTKQEYRCDPLTVYQGQTFNSYFAVREAGELAKGRTGFVPVRVVIKGSRGLALTDPRVTRYFSGEITSPVLRLKVGPDAP